eukprot:gene3657-4177_t
MELGLKPGSVVVESGTGSGSLSHAFLRTIMPSGHLYTFDFHQQRTDQARKDFEDHGLSSYVTSNCRDVCSDGFNLSNIADAVFLDLPKPYDVIKFAKVSLKISGGRLCSFSPCIEQVQKTCEQLRILGFCEIKTVECLCNTLEVKTVPLPKAKFEETNPVHVQWNEFKLPDEDMTSLADEPNDDKREPVFKRPHSELTDTIRDARGKKQRTGHQNVLTCRPIKNIPAVLPLDRTPMTYTSMDAGHVHTTTSEVVFWVSPVHVMVCFFTGTDSNDVVVGQPVLMPNTFLIYVIAALVVK